MLIRIFKKLIERLKLFKISKLKKRNFLKKSLKIWEILGKISKILILNLKIFLKILLFFLKFNEFFNNFVVGMNLSNQNLKMAD